MDEKELKRNINIVLANLESVFSENKNELNSDSYVDLVDAINILKRTLKKL